jgi:hypothetical protein
MFEAKWRGVFVFVRCRLDRVGPNRRIGQRLAGTQNLPNLLERSRVAKVELGKTADDPVALVGEASKADGSERNKRATGNRTAGSHRTT